MIHLGGLLPVFFSQAKPLPLAVWRFYSPALLRLQQNLRFTIREIKMQMV